MHGLLSLDLGFPGANVNVSFLVLLICGDETSTKSQNLEHRLPTLPIEDYAEWLFNGELVLPMEP